MSKHALNPYELIGIAMCRTGLQHEKEPDRQIHKDAQDNVIIKMDFLMEVYRKYLQNMGSLVTENDKSIGIKRPDRWGTNTGVNVFITKRFHSDTGNADRSTIGAVANTIKELEKKGRVREPHEIATRMIATTARDLAEIVIGKDWREKVVEAIKAHYAGGDFPSYEYRKILDTRTGFKLMNGWKTYKNGGMAGLRFQESALLIEAQLPMFEYREGMIYLAKSALPKSIIEARDLLIGKRLDQVIAGLPDREGFKSIIREAKDYPGALKLTLTEEMVPVGETS